MIDEDKLYENFNQMFKLMKVSMDDDYDNDMRFASVVLLKHILGYIQAQFDSEDYK